MIKTLQPKIMLAALQRVAVWLSKQCYNQKPWGLIRAPLYGENRSPTLNEWTPAQIGDRSHTEAGKCQFTKSE